MTNLFSSSLFLPKLNKMGIPLISSSPRSFESGARSVDIVSPNFCDQTSWYQQAYNVTNQATTDVTPQGSNNLVFQLTNHNSVVMLNTRTIYMEEGRILAADGTLKSISDFVFHVFDDQDDVTSEVLEVNFSESKITFKESFVPQGAITFSGFVINRNERVKYIIKPPPNVEIFVITAEMQFTTDVDISARDQALRVEVLSGFGVVPFEQIPLDLGEFDTTSYSSFAYNPYDNSLFGHHFGRRKDYYSWEDFEGVSNVGKNVIPVWGDKPMSTIEFPFNYLEGFSLSAAQFTGMRLYVLDTGDSAGPIEGTYATITLYTRWREIT